MEEASGELDEKWVEEGKFQKFDECVVNNC